MMKSKKLLAAALVAAMSLSSFAVTNVSAADVELEFLDTMASPAREEFFTNFFEEYEAETGVKVTYTTVPYEEANKKMMAMISAGTLPDIVCAAGWTSLVEMGGLEPLTDRWNSYEYLDEMMPATHSAIRDMSYYKGEIYCIPDSFILRGLFVRTDWMEEAGLNVEDYRNMTWDQYYELIDILTDPEKGRYGCAFRGGGLNWNAYKEYTQSMMENVSMFLNDGTYNSIFSKPEALDYFHDTFDMYFEGSCPEESINWGYPEMVEGFISGMCGTLIQTPEVVPVCQEAMEDGTWAVLAYPRKEGAEKDVMTWGSSTSYMMSANSENKDAAWDLLAKLSSPEINLEYCKAFGAIPIYQAALEDPFFAEGPQRGYIDRLTSEKFATACETVPIPQQDYFNSEYSMAEIQKFLLGEQTAEDTVKNLDQWLTTEYEKACKEAEASAE